MTDASGKIFRGEKCEFSVCAGLLQIRRGKKRKPVEVPDFATGRQILHFWTADPDKIDLFDCLYVDCANRLVVQTFTVCKAGLSHHEVRCVMYNPPETGLVANVKVWAGEIVDEQTLVVAFQGCETAKEDAPEKYCIVQIATGPGHTGRTQFMIDRIDLFRDALERALDLTQHAPIKRIY